MKNQGANKGATTAFLISTPESGVDSIAITYALLDPIMTVIRPVAAFITAIAAGVLENVLDWQTTGKKIEPDLSCPVDNCCDGKECSDEVHARHHTSLEKLVAGLRFALVEVWGDIVIWFFVGLLVAAVITVLVPEELMTSVLGGGLSSMFIMLLVGVPLYICATASTPVAAALILKGVSPGAALVFLLVGPATNITSLSVLIRLLGKMSTIRYLLVLAGCAVVFGLGVDVVYQRFGISPQAIIGEATEIVPPLLKLFGAVILLALSVKPIYQAVAGKFTKKESKTEFVCSFPDLSEAHQSEKHDHSNHSSCGCGH